MRYDYDVIVIGGGAAGLTAAGMSSVLGAKTALIERNKLGGDCTWHGCIPSKTLLKAAKVAHEMRTASKYGLIDTHPVINLQNVMQHVRAIRERVYEHADSPPNLEKIGVEVIQAEARFLDQHSIEVREGEFARKLSSRYFVIATGSRPRKTEIPGIAGARVLTNETIFELDTLPPRLLILGAGPIGIEMSQAFSRLGSHVTVVDTGERILRHDDAELAAVLQNVLAKEDIRFHLQTGIARIEANAAYTNDGHQIAFDAILLATGRQPDFATLNVIAASIQTNEKGIIVDRHCRTSTRHIYACGDVTGKYLFTHMAEHMAKVAATNAITGFPAKTDDEHLTWCTFTDPELAHAGATEDDLRRTGTNYSVYRFPFSRLDRAITESESNGVIKILATRSGRILGASILGAHAGDMIAEWALAMRNRIRLSAIASTIHPYPTYSLGNRRAADLFVTGKLSPTLVRWLQRFRRLRGNATNITRLDA